MKIMAAPVVALLKNVEAPVLPNRVWLEPPPKAAPMSAPFPVWSSTIMINAILTIIWMMISKIDIVNFSNVDTDEHGSYGYYVVLETFLRRNDGVSKLVRSPSIFIM